MKTLSKTLLAATLGLSMTAAAIAAPAANIPPTNATATSTQPAATLQAGTSTTVTHSAVTATHQNHTDKDAKRAERMAKMKAEQAALFQQADANKDGKLSEAEFAKFQELCKTARENHKQERAKERFKRLDTNKDGVLSLEELQAGHGKMDGAKHRQHMMQGMPKAAQ